MKHGYTDTNDATLVVKAKAGDAAAFEALYDRHVSGIARTLASFAGPDRDLLDDLTQEVFFRAIERLASYEPVRPFAHWLYTIALNVGRNHVRNHRKIVLLEPDQLDRVADARVAARELPDELIGLALMREVAKLPRELREVVSLRIGSILPYGEIGNLLGIPEGTARSRMHTALNLLKERMGMRQRRRNDNERQA